MDHIFRHEVSELKQLMILEIILHHSHFRAKKFRSTTQVESGSITKSTTEP